MVAFANGTAGLARRSPDAHRDEDGWPGFVANFAKFDPALRDCVIRAMAMSDFIDIAEAAYRGGATPDHVRALLLRAVLEGMQW